MSVKIQTRNDKKLLLKNKWNQKRIEIKFTITANERTIGTIIDEYLNLKTSET